jgi:uncharacterized membrane protein
MNTFVDVVSRQPLDIEVQHVSLWRPFVWLARGTADLFKCAPGNFAHGLLMFVLGWVLLFLLGNHPYFIAAAVSGFLLVAPVMATGVCELSRRRRTGEALNFDGSLAPIASDGVALFKFGGLLALLAALWFVISEVLLRSAFAVSSPSVTDTFYHGFLDTANRAQLLSYAGTGAVLAWAVFLVSVVTVPLIIDRHASASQAMRASVRVALANPLAMLLWSAMIVALAAFGFATFLFGMIIVIPILGHATWHAYRELVR